MMQKMTHGFIAWFIVTLFVVYSFCLNTAAAVFSESIRTSLGLDSTGVSIALGAFIAGFALMQIPAGYLLDRYNTKAVVSASVLLLAAGNFIISFTHDVVWFSLSNLVQGMGASFAFIAAGVITSRWFSQRWFPVMFGLTQTISCLFSAIIHYTLSVELAVRPWEEIYKILSVVGVVIFVLSLIGVKSPRDHQGGEQVSLPQSLRKVFKDSNIILCALAAATSFGTLLAYASFWYLDVEKFYSVATLDAVIISGMIFTGIGIGTPIMGWLSNKLQSRKAMIHITLCLGIMSLLLCLYMPHFQTNDLTTIKIVSLVTGFLLSGSMLFYTVASELATDQTRGVALSITNTGVFLFNTILMFIPYAFVTARSTTFFTYLWTLPFSILIAILLNYFIKESFTGR